MTTLCGRNSDDMFFLTKTYTVEITTIGYPGNDGYPYSNESLCHYAWQGIKADSTEELDMFGRNRTDRLFIQMCELVFGLVMGNEDTFKSLSCKKENDHYTAKLELTSETIEMELTEMVKELQHRAAAGVSADTPT